MARPTLSIRLIDSQTIQVAARVRLESRVIFSGRADATKEYVRQIEGVYRIAGTRVSLDSLVHLFREGVSAESMVESYPAVTLEQVHGALAFYLANRSEIDGYLLEGQRVAEQENELSRQNNAELIARLRRARHESHRPAQPPAVPD